VKAAQTPPIPPTQLGGAPATAMPTSPMTPAAAEGGQAVPAGGGWQAAK
jgi:hypothetical protein